jgi:hypothetical protein
MYSNVVCKRKGVSGTGFGLSFARFGSAIWTNVQTSNRSSYHLRPICCVYYGVWRKRLFTRKPRPSHGR